MSQVVINIDFDATPPASACGDQRTVTELIDLFFCNVKEQSGCRSGRGARKGAADGWKRGRSGGGVLGGGRGAERRQRPTEPKTAGKGGVGEGRAETAGKIKGGWAGWEMSKSAWACGLGGYSNSPCAQRTGKGAV